MKKTFYINILIIIITAFSFVIGYVEAMEVPVYAADEIEWEDLSGDDLVDAFKAYCKSRKLFIDGSIPDAVTSFTSQTFDNICNTLGIDMTALQAELKKRYDNGIYKYLFTVSGLNGFNRIFAEFLQNNDLSVGDQVDDQPIYNGKFFRGYFLYEINSTEEATNLRKSYLTKTGTRLVSSDYFRNIFYTQYPNYSFDQPGVIGSTHSFQFLDYSQNFSVRARISLGADMARYGNLGLITNTSVPAFTRPDASYTFDPTFCYIRLSNGKVFSAALTIDSLGYFTYHSFHSYNADSVENANIYVTTNNTTINNETVINEGDTYIIDDDGTVDDGTGGGSGEGEGGGSGEGEGGGSGEGEGGGSGEGDTIINFPDIDFNIPDIDFSLSGLTAKFPFCIPFDIVSLLTLLNAEPQAPRIQGSVPIGSWTTWEIDFDFSRFDDFAAIMRGFEIVGFIFFLIGATIRFVKG